MPKPYSLDLRERVVSYVEAGHSRRAAAAHFRVSPCVCHQFNDGFSRGNAGQVAPKARSAAGDTASSIRTASSSLRRVARERTTSACLELAGELQAASGVKADPASLLRWLIRNWP